MIKPIFKHHDKSHKFIGHVAHKGQLWDIYLSKGDEWGEELHARCNNEKYCQTMPLKMIEGGGTRDSALEAGKLLLLSKRKHIKVIA